MIMERVPTSIFLNVPYSGNYKDTQFNIRNTRLKNIVEYVDLCYNLNIKFNICN